MSRESKIKQIFGAFLKHEWILSCSLVSIVLTILFYTNIVICKKIWTYFFLSLSIVLILVLLIKSARTLSVIFTLRKEEIWITRSLIFLLIVIILLVIASYVFIGVLLFCKFGDVAESIIPGTCICAVIGWIFQDSIKGAATFVKLRLKGLLNIGDWVKLDKSGVDGKIKNISLTTLTIENWDSTTSSIPMSILYSEQLQNLQRMNDGRTNGRRMLKEFIIDSSWVHMLDKNDITKLESVLGKEDPFFQEQVKEGKQNIQVCREYLNYYLHTHPRVSHEPRLIVRWMKHTKEGLTLQLYAFLMDTSLVSFEKTQSEIFEHTIKSLSWFGLKLYQTPSSYDSKSSTIYLANKNETE